jgi:hypothetical protein
MNAELKILNHQFYLKELLVLFFTFFLMEGCFSWIFIRNSIVIEMYSKVLSLVLFGYMLFNYPRLKRGERIIFILFIAMLLKLVIESLAKYDTVFQQLTMFTVLFPVIYVLFIKYILRTMELDLLEFMAKFYMIVYFLFMVLFGWGFSFSLDSVDMTDYGPFSGDTRIIHASHILMMIIPFLWYLDKYINTKKTKFLLPFLICCVIIVVHQHRSVWSSTLVALLFYCFATIRNRVKNFAPLRNLAIGIGVTSLIAWFLISNLFPGFFDFLYERFSEIFDPAREGSTGNFRLLQRDVYGALFLQKPFFGWTFEGFEMPNPLVDWWPDGTGQHFHEGYMEMLFYLGIAGLLLKYYFLFYFLVKIFRRKLSPEAIILISFGISGLVFSFNYVLPLVFWGIVGMGLYYIDRDKENENSESLVA